MEYELDVLDSNDNYNILQSELPNYEDKNYNQIILEERAEEMKELAQDIEELSEISRILGKMIYQQGENIDVIDNNIQSAVMDLEFTIISLEKSNEYAIKLRRNVKNAAIVIGSSALGAFGFIGGPIIGIAAMISGGMTGFGLVVASEKNMVNI